MSRYDFIEKLRAALSGKATQSTINESVRYYEEYFDTELRKGKSEEEVLRQLGDPRLLAKSIVEANKQVGRTSSGAGGYSDTVDFETENGRRGAHMHRDGGEYKIQKWVLILIAVLVVLLIISLVGTVLRFVLRIVIPVVLILAAVKIIAVLFRRE